MKLKSFCDFKPFVPILFSRAIQHQTQIPTRYCFLINRPKYGEVGNWLQSSFYDKILDQNNKERKTNLGSWFGSTGRLGKEGGARARGIWAHCVYSKEEERRMFTFPLPPVFPSVWDPSP